MTHEINSSEKASRRVIQQPVSTLIDSVTAQLPFFRCTNAGAANSTLLVQTPIDRCYAAPAYVTSDLLTR